jgi:hypothetical protein
LSPTATVTTTAANTFRHTQPLHKANTLPPLQKKLESLNNTISTNKSSSTSTIAAIVKPTQFQQKLAQAKCIHLSCYTSYTASVSSEQRKRARSSKKRMQQQQREQNNSTTAASSTVSNIRANGASHVNIPVPAVILAGDITATKDSAAKR